jgi:prepilin peptidase CpaA
MLDAPGQLEIPLIVFALALAIIDWRTHRIPNLLCAIAAMYGLTLQVAINGEAGLFAALGGTAVGFAMFLPFYVVRAFGAGDVKAMATVGIFLGVQSTVHAVGFTLIAGGVLGVLTLCLKPAYTSATLRRLVGLLRTPVASMRDSKRNPSSDSRLRFPYGIAIACGVAVALIIKTH